MGSSKQKAAVLARARQAPLTQAAETLASVCRLIDGGADPRNAVVQVMFAEGREGLSRAVDAHIEAKAVAEGLFETAKRVKAEWEKRRKRMGQIVDAIDLEMRAALQEKPDLPYDGTLGTVRLVTNPGELITAWGDGDLTPDLIAQYKIPMEYVRVETTYALEKDAVKRDLRAGKWFDWAVIDQEQRVEVTP